MTESWSQTDQCHDNEKEAVLDDGAECLWSSAGGLKSPVAPQLTNLIIKCKFKNLPLSKNKEKHGTETEISSKLRWQEPVFGLVRDWWNKLGSVGIFLLLA